MLGRFNGPCTALTFFRGRILRNLKTIGAVLLVALYPPVYGKKSIRSFPQSSSVFQNTAKNLAQNQKLKFSASSPRKITNLRNAGFGNRPGYVGLNQTPTVQQPGAFPGAYANLNAVVYPALPGMESIATSNSQSFVPYFLLALAGLAIASLSKFSKSSPERGETPSGANGDFSPDVSGSPAGPPIPDTSDRDSGGFDRGFPPTQSAELPRSPRVSKPSIPDLTEVSDDDFADGPQNESKETRLIGPSTTPFPRSTREREISSDTKVNDAAPTPSPLNPPPRNRDRSSPDRTDDRVRRPLDDSPEYGPSKMLSVKQRKQLAHGPGLQWDGCDKSAAIQGGQGPRCGVDYLHPSFVKQIDTHLINCLGNAARKVGLQAPAKIFIGHFGCYVNRSIRGGSGLSNHAYARAIDVKDIKMMDAAGRTIASMSAHVNQYSGRNKTLYDHFRLCWKKNLPRQCASQKGSIGIPRSELGGNSSHNDHLHLEFPPGCG